MSFTTGSFFHTLYTRGKKGILLIALFALLTSFVVPSQVVDAAVARAANEAPRTVPAQPAQTTPSRADAAQAMKDQAAALAKANGGVDAATAGRDATNAALANGTTRAADQAAIAATPTTASNQQIKCWGGITVGFIVPGCIAIATFTLLGLVSWVLWLAAVLFELAIPYTLNMADFIKDIPIVALGWSTFRDVANLLFIFIILYIAIGMTISDDSFGGKKLLGKVIIGAVLINFSLFFTQAMVDVSNIFALQFYNKITQNDAAKANAADGGLTGASKLDSGISATFVDALGLKTVWDLGKSDANTGNSGAKTLDINTQQSVLGLNSTNLLIASIGGIILVLITSFVFFAATILFLIRAVTLIFLMILSPLAFLGNVLPALGSLSKQWWSALTSNLLFAPAYMALLYLVISIVADPDKFKGVGGSKGSFVGIFAGNDNMIPTAMTFVVLNMMMIGCLMIASKLGVAGGAAAEKMGKSFGKNMAMRFSGANLAMSAGRGVGNFGKDVGGGVKRGAAGFIGDKISNSPTLARLSSKPYFGRVAAIAMQKGDELKGAKIGGKSFNDQVKAEQANYTKRGNLIEKALGGGAAGRAGEAAYLDKKRFSYASNTAIKKASKAASGIDNKEALEALTAEGTGKFSQTNHNAAKDEVDTLTGQIKTVRASIKNANPVSDKDAIAANSAKLSALVSERAEQQAIVDGYQRSMEKLNDLNSK